MVIGVNPTGVQLTPPNLIINGGFNVVQRGTSFTAATTPANNDDTYTIDRWILLSDGNDIVDLSQETSVVPSGSAVSCKLEVATANKKFGILQIVENRNSLAVIGEVCSVSFKAQKVVGNTTVDKLRAAVISWDSTTDMVTSDVVSAWNGEGVDPTLVANWTYENTPSDLTLTDDFQTFTINNISIDTASTNNIALFVWCDNADGTVGDLVYIADVNLTPTSVAMPFVEPNANDNLMNCLRYTIVLTADAKGALASGYFNSTTVVVGVLNFPAFMRVKPTITQSGTTSDFNITRPGTSTASAASLQAATQISYTSCTLNWTSASTSTVGFGNEFLLTSTAQITADSEL